MDDFLDEDDGDVGIRFSRHPSGAYVVVATIAGGPARTSGEILPNDLLLSVDGVKTKGRSPEQVLALLEGPLCERVALAMARPDMVGDYVNSKVSVRLVHRQANNAKSKIETCASDLIPGTVADYNSEERQDQTQVVPKQELQQLVTLEEARTLEQDIPHDLNSNRTYVNSGSPCLHSTGGVRMQTRSEVSTLDTSTIEQISHPRPKHRASVVYSFENGAVPEYQILDDFLEAREADHTWKINAHNPDDSNTEDARGRAESLQVSSLINSYTRYSLSMREDSQRILDASTKAGGEGNLETMSHAKNSGPQYNKVLYASLNGTSAGEPWERAGEWGIAEFGRRSCYAGRLPADYTLSSTPSQANTQRDTADSFDLKTSFGHANDADDKDRANSQSTAKLSLMREQYNLQHIRAAEKREIAINTFQKDQEREDKVEDEKWPTIRERKELEDGRKEATNRHQDESKQRDDDKPGQQEVEEAQAFDTVSQEAQSGAIRSDSTLGDSSDQSRLFLSTQDSTVNTHRGERAQGAGCAVPECIVPMEALAGVWSTQVNREQDRSTSIHGNRIRFATQLWSSSRDVGSSSFAPTNSLGRRAVSYTPQLIPAPEGARMSSLTMRKPSGIHSSPTPNPSQHSEEHQELSKQYFTGNRKESNPQLERRQCMHQNEPVDELAVANKALESISTSLGEFFLLTPRRVHTHQEVSFGVPSTTSASPAVVARLNTGISEPPSEPPSYPSRRPNRDMQGIVLEGGEVGKVSTFERPYLSPIISRDLKPSRRNDEDYVGQESTGEGREDCDGRRDEGEGPARGAVVGNASSGEEESAMHKSVFSWMNLA